MKKEKILITGGSGFVGTNFIDKLPKDIYEIFSLDIEEPKINISNVNYLNMDIRSSRLGELIKNINPKIILHLAAQSSVAISSKDPLLDNDVNLNGSLNLFLHSTKSNVEQFISFSTGGAIYGEELGKSFKESDPTKPLSPYGVSKLNFENYLNYFSAIKKFNCKTTILRPSNIYGPWQNPLGEAGVVSIFADKMLKNENVSIFGNGSEYRDYIYIDDVTEFAFKTINKKIEGTFNISSGKTTKTIEIFNYISNIIGFKKPPIFLDKREGDIFGIEIDNSKSKSIGWSPIFDLKSGLENTVKFLKDK
tara:strand:+ start:646 stop:1566 length:921 start_codon:yes stop_codon:yes gene_type:complete